MGVGISGWKLAREVSRQGQLGVVSGTALDVVLARSLQLGDPEGHLRRALAAFPLQDATQRILGRYFIEGGKAEDAPFRAVPEVSLKPSSLSRDLMLAGSFVHIYLAKENHQLPVGINLLEKIKLPTLYVLFGAMLAGVDVVLMGAGIPRPIPGILDQLAQGEKAIHQVEGTEAEGQMVLDPRTLCSEDIIAQLKRPRFIAIVSSTTLARHLISKASGRVDGFVVEGHTAGGHNAPPRKKDDLSPEGEPVYGPKDQANPSDFVELGLPFWLAGGYGRPGGLEAALATGATGIQVGTAFALCQESGLDPDIKRSILDRIEKDPDSLKVFTSPQASPTGFPFKIVPVEGSVSDPAVYAKRKRICDIGLLREIFTDADGKLDYRCPADACDRYLAKGGDAKETEGRLCLCNGLLATIGLGQVRKGSGTEPPLVTAGDDLSSLGAFLEDKISPLSYSARDVLRLIGAGTMAAV
jgi:nitronate monooxygenase